MEIELIIDCLVSLKRELYYKRIILKNYCNKRNLSYTSTSRILTKGHMHMTLRTAYRILGLTPERNISQGALNLKLKDLLDIKQSFNNRLI